MKGDEDPDLTGDERRLRHRGGDHGGQAHRGRVADAREQPAPRTPHALRLGADGGRGLLPRMGERLLRLPLANRLEHWERSRKVRRFAREMGLGTEDGRPLGRSEERFGPDWCKGHFDHHGARTLAAFSQRLEMLAEGWR